MKNNPNWRWISAIPLATLPVLLGVVQAGPYELSRTTIDGGGGTMSGGGFKLSGTIGQPDASRTLTEPAGHFELTGGFWFPLASGDCNTDGGVNLIDYTTLELCIMGPEGGIPQACNCFDMDQDNDIDLLDVARFAYSFTNG